jgi:REP element-mobilizing transposase RayT
MAQSLSAILIHLIFSTKNREPFITPAIEKELHPYIATIFRELKSPTLTLNGTSDHLHILFSLGRVIKIADIVEEVKTGSSKWIKTKGREFRNLPLAERLRCFFDRTIQCYGFEALHPGTESAPPTHHVSG